MWCIHNAIELEKRGLGTATLCSSKFLSLVMTTALEKGFKHLPCVVVPHPIAGNDDDAIRRKADDAIDDLIRVLTNGKTIERRDENTHLERGDL